MEPERKNLNFKNSYELTTLSEQILDASKQELYLSMRHMFIALNAFTYERDQRIFFLATDGTKIYYNPIKLIETYRNNPVDINRAILHMVMHCIFRHIYSGSDKDRQIWNLACDISAEYIIDRLTLSVVLKPDNDKKNKIYEEISENVKIFSAQNIYYWLIKKPEEYIEKLDTLKIFTVDEHDYWEKTSRSESGTDNETDDDTDEEKSNDRENKGSKKDNNRIENNEENSSKWENIARKIETQISISGNGRGDEKGNFTKILRAGNKKRMLYSDFLRKFAVLKERMNIDPDSFDYGFYHYSMELYKNMPLIEELEYKEEHKIEDFVIVLDTSGSCQADLIDKFLNITFDILGDENSFFEKVRIHIIQCDNEVQDDTVLSDVHDFMQFKDNFKIKGFGGTDFRPAFNYVNNLIDMKKLRPRGLIYFTDGYGTYPKIKPPYETAFVFVNDNEEKKDFPGWAMKIVVDEENLK